MNGTMTVVKVDGSMHTTSLDAAPTLEELQAAVGGSIETVPGFHNTPNGVPVVVFCNEEGKLNHLAYNHAAQMMWVRVAPEYAKHDLLVGDVVILQGDTEFMDAI